jgi:hypothetical protein
MSLHRSSFILAQCHHLSATRFLNLCFALAASLGLFGSEPQWITAWIGGQDKANTAKTYETRTLDSLVAFSGSEHQGRSVFGGFTQLPRQKATGFFRVEKLNQRWWFIDPEGYPYYETGCAVVVPGGGTVQKLFR